MDCNENRRAYYTFGKSNWLSEKSKSSTNI